MAALIAAHGRGPSSGIVGIAPDAKVLPVVISKTGTGIDSKVMAAGVTWATNHKAEIINVSASTGPGFELKDAIDSALRKDIVVVAAVGNTSSDAIINYPSAFDGVLAVGATGRNGKYSSSSVKDAKVQICAPGVDIISAQPTKSYGSATGTSDATAIVSGAAALVRAKFPHLAAADVINRLTATADDIGPAGRDDECGFGRLNIVRALTADVPPLGSGSTAAPSSGAVSSSAPGVTRPQFASPAAAPQVEQEPASGSGALWLGGLAAAVAAVGVVSALVLRRRRGG